MKSLKKDLQALTRELKALTKKSERLAKAVAKLLKAQVVPKTKGKPKAGARKTGTKKAPAKKAAAVTATDQILKIIKRSKKGVDVATLKKKTGFGDRTVRNIVFRATKQGKIKSAGRGLYLGA